MLHSPPTPTSPQETLPVVSHYSEQSYIKKYWAYRTKENNFYVKAVFTIKHIKSYKL